MSASSISTRSSIDTEYAILMSICQQHQNNIKEAASQFDKLRFPKGKICQKKWGKLATKDKKIKEKNLRDRKILHLTKTKQESTYKKLQAQFTSNGSLTEEEINELMDSLLLIAVTMQLTSVDKLSMTSRGQRLQYLFSQVVTRCFEGVSADIEQAVMNRQKERGDELIERTCSCIGYVRRLQLSIKWLPLPSSSSRAQKLEQDLTRLCGRCMMLRLPARGINEVHYRNSLSLILETLQLNPHFFETKERSILMIDRREELFKQCLWQAQTEPEMLQGFVYYAVTTDDRSALRALKQNEGFVQEIPMWMEHGLFHKTSQTVLTLEQHLKSLVDEQLTIDDFLEDLEKIRTYLQEARSKLGNLGSALKLIPRETNFGKIYHGTLNLINELENRIHEYENGLIFEKEEWGFLGHGKKGLESLSAAADVPQSIISTVNEAQKLIGDREIYFGKQMPPEISSMIAHRDKVAFVLHQQQKEKKYVTWYLTYWNAHGILTHQPIPIENFSLNIAEFAQRLDPTILEVFLHRKQEDQISSNKAAASSSSNTAQKPIESHILNIRESNFTSCIRLIKERILYKKRGTVWEEILNDLEGNADHMGWTCRNKAINLTSEARGSNKNLKENSKGTITTTRRTIDDHHYSYVYAQILAASAVEEYERTIARLDNKKNYSQNKGAQLVFALTGLVTHSSTNDLTLITSGEMNFSWLIQTSYRIAKEKEVLLDWFANAFEGLCFEDRYRNLLEYFQENLYVRAIAASSGNSSSSKQEQAGALLTEKDTANEVVMKCISPFQDAQVKSLGLKVAPGKPGDKFYEKYDDLLSIANLIDYIKIQLDLNSLPVDRFTEKQLKEQIEPLGIFF